MPQEHNSLSGDMVIHTKARDLLVWLLPHLARWPKEQRFGVTQHVGALAMRTQDALVAARHLAPAQRAEALLEADIALDQLRQYLHLAWQCRWMSESQYLHACGLLAELGPCWVGGASAKDRGRGGPHRLGQASRVRPGGYAPQPHPKRRWLLPDYWAPFTHAGGSERPP